MISNEKTQVVTMSDLEKLWKAAKETVTVHHYNGSPRDPMQVDKYRELKDYINNNPRLPN